MPYSGVVYEGGYDEDSIVEMCHHEHRTSKEAQACGDAMARATPVEVQP